VSAFVIEVDIHVELPFFARANRIRSDIYLTFNYRNEIQNGRKK